MKNFVLFTFLFSVSAAFACPDGKVCRGDTVIPETYTQGYAIVKAINPSTGRATVKGNYSTNYHRYYVNQLAITRGCMKGICVGANIIPDTYSQGYAIVKGINTYSRKYTVKGNYSSNYHRYDKYRVSVTRGCFDGICVGDKVFPDAYSEGYAIVKAINPTSGKFTVKGNYSSNYHRYTSRSLALIEECLDYNYHQRRNWRFE